MDANLAPEERVRESAMRAKLTDLIQERGGAIGFDAWMQCVLQDEDWGYYSNHPGEFGARGDYTTAPELSPLYSACLARQCAQILQDLGGGSILEIGAGSGRMAHDLLSKLDEWDCLPQRYLIFDPSKRLRECQQSRLAAYAQRTAWVDRLPTQAMRGIVLANESLDALPIKRFAIRRREILEQGVGVASTGRFHFREFEADGKLRNLLDKRLPCPPEEFPDGYCSEINAALAPWILTLAQCLQKGVMLFIDYGYPAAEYYHPQRSMGTLLCHYRHHSHDDPFTLPGLQDITASVDFTAVAAAGAQAGLRLLGYASQAWFLMGNGLEKELQRIADTDMHARIEIARQARLLTLPGEMGERFKALALGRDWDSPLRGFALHDQRGALNRGMPH